MPPVFGAIGAAFTGITAASIGGFLASTAVSIGLSLLAQKLLAKKVDRRPSGTQIPGQSSGEDVSQTFILGKRATAGHLVYRNSYAELDRRPNALLVEVIELSDIPGIKLERVMIDDRYTEVEATDNHLLGRRLLDIKNADGTVRAWMRFYDGTQTEADEFLVSRFGAGSSFSNTPGYNWSPDRIGTGTAYVVMVYRYDREVFQSLPRAVFEVSGIPLYDPRKDSSVGGDGPHRWGQPATYEPSSNSAVQVYNLLRGVVMPTGEIYGGGIDAADIPLANAVAGMNICDDPINGRPQFQTCIEVDVAEDEPASVIEEILGGSLGQIAEVGGVWRMRFGAPAAPVMSFNDGDISISDPQQFDPIKGLEATHNAIVATYVEPADLYQPRTTDLLRNLAWEAEDGARLLPIDVQLGTVTNRNQANQIKAALIQDERRQRQHSLVLPPDAMGLDPLDDVRWTSDVNGYVDKDFEVAQTLWRTQSGMMQVTIRERDPADYVWTGADELPDPPDTIPMPALTPVVLPGWAVTAVAVLDDQDTPRRPAIRLSWADMDFTESQLVHWQIRLAGGLTVVTQGATPALDLEHTCVDAILPDTGYEARGLVMTDGRPSAWTDWLGAVSADIRPGLADLDPSIQEEFDALNDRADDIIADVDSKVADARQDAADALAQARSDLEDADAALAGDIDDLSNDVVAQVSSARQDAADALAQARSDLEAADGVLASDISSLTATVGNNTAAIQQEATARANADTALAADITDLTATVDDNAAAISQEAVARADADSALAADISTLTTAVGDNTAAISQEAVARADADAALAFDISTVQASAGDNAAAIQQESSARAAADRALASDILLLSAEIGDNAAGVLTESIARADADSVLAGQITTIGASVGDNTAAIQQEAIARADADSALAADISTVQSSVNGLDASVTQQATAISTLEGNAAATLAFRTKAGSAGAELELIAADDPSGSTSIARISATDIILNGTVTAELINVVELSAISATLGTFQSAPTGERTVIETDRISVFDSSNTLRVRIGRLD